jgi:hypothetical protein
MGSLFAPGKKERAISKLFFLIFIQLKRKINVYKYGVKTTLNF